MRIVIPTIGTRGDVQPFVALAQSLERAGFSATLMSHPVMGELVESHGVAFVPVGPDIDLGRETAAIRAQSGNVMLGLVRAMGFAFDMLEKCHDDILAGCREADLVVVPASSAAGRNEADLLSLPHVSVTFMPWAIAEDDPDRSLARRAVYSAINRAAGLITTRPLNRIRRRLGLPPVGPEGFTSTLLNLVPVSPAVYPPSPHWAAHNHMTGYWFVDEAEGWRPPADLLAFLNNDERPVVISLGAISLYEENAMETAGLFVEAIRQAGVRAIIQGWGESLQKLDLPPTICVAGSLPHGWLLSQAAGLAHHGGFGTTGVGFRAGIPQLVIPHLADQFYWGQRVQHLGVGPPAIRRSKLDVPSLAAGLRRLVDDDGLSTAAKSLGERVRGEDGVKTAVRLIEKVFQFC